MTREAIINDAAAKAADTIIALTADDLECVLEIEEDDALTLSLFVEIGPRGALKSVRVALGDKSGAEVHETSDSYAELISIGREAITKIIAEHIDTAIENEMDQCAA
ncbi:hypothetical protein [Paracoccus homiensis]|uniref:hypothetical protein n=1 Tax=Paracoccus homiensis TaxID=364199 RepID=UPI00398CC600